MGSENDMAELEAASVPVTHEACRNCANPCDEGHDEYPAKFGADYESEMRGSVKPYHRQVVISTGKTDWPHDISDEKDTLAAYLTDAQNELSKKHKPKPSHSQQNGTGTEKEPVVRLSKQPEGVLRSSDATRLSILNGSHTSCSTETNQQTVIVLPDYIAVCDVPPSKAASVSLWKSALDPAVDRFGVTSEGNTFQTWTLPYSCVILLCSHKKRDNRCAIAAPKLETAFIQHLQHAGWSVDTQLEDLSCTGEPLEKSTQSPEERAVEAIRRLKVIGEGGKHRALVIKNSHVGGHKFAGNVIIYKPQGSGIWYGRVTPHEVDAIVKSTIIDGKVFPALLRGGLDISRPGCQSLNDW
ncbi:Sucraseferredoxin-like protein [Rickenella mellea]|uniref:Sucraseferredoxin-like protein n=1 Tax=Rickenella mellea TaxID=50990 RepID=A0A4R5XGB5_9AGAM|nr:Sucraseferredoxin-like protein [Rickenella mellea]